MDPSDNSDGKRASDERKIHEAEKLVEAAEELDDEAEEESVTPSFDAREEDEMAAPDDQPTRKSDGKRASDERKTHEAEKLVEAAEELDDEAEEESVTPSVDAREEDEMATPDDQPTRDPSEVVAPDVQQPGLPVSLGAFEDVAGMALSAKNEVDKLKKTVTQEKMKTEHAEKSAEDYKTRAFEALRMAEQREMEIRKAKDKLSEANERAREANERAREATREANERVREATREGNERVREATREGNERAREATREADEQARKAVREADEQARKAVREADERARGAAREADERARGAAREADERVREAIRGADERVREAEERVREAEERVREAAREAHDPVPGADEGGGGADLNNESDTLRGKVDERLLRRSSQACFFIIAMVFAIVNVAWADSIVQTLDDLESSETEIANNTCTSSASEFFDKRDETSREFETLSSGILVSSVAFIVQLAFRVTDLGLLRKSFGGYRRDGTAAGKRAFLDRAKEKLENKFSNTKFIEIASVAAVAGSASSLLEVARTLEENVRALMGRESCDEFFSEDELTDLEEDSERVVVFTVIIGGLISIAAAIEVVYEERTKSVPSPPEVDAAPG
eukprot:scaffold6033_cov124-Pinguiococcus_pyrenoidosus.AAC.4